MVSDWWQTGVLTNANTSIFGGIGSIFRYWYRYWNSSTFYSTSILSLLAATMSWLIDQLIKSKAIASCCINVSISSLSFPAKMLA